MLIPTEDAIDTLTEPIFSLVYASASEKSLSDDELESILVTSRRNNLRTNITGMLLYYEGGFMQILEGDEVAVRALYAVIGRDRRHRHLVNLVEEYSPTRMFPNWLMGFQRLTLESVRQIEGFTHFTDVKHFLEYCKDRPQDSLIVMSSFLDRLQQDG